VAERDQGQVTKGLRIVGGCALSWRDEHRVSDKEQLGKLGYPFVTFGDEIRFKNSKQAQLYPRVRVPS
jgi:hypothetical protein